MDPYFGEIAHFAFDFAPQGWAICAGQMIAISSNTALFSLIGTTFGGDGRTIFALPNIEGKAVVGLGQGMGLSSYTLGETIGAITNGLTSKNLPRHTHTIVGTNEAGDTASPQNAYYANTGDPDKEYKTNTFANDPNNVSMSTAALVATGNGTPFSIMQPSLVLNFCICLYGAYPSRP